MGQALRRATGRLRSSRPLPPEPPAVVAKNTGPPRPPPPPTVPAERDIKISGQDRLRLSDSEGISSIQEDHGALEDRDPGYDAMLSKMVGTITSKAGGKLEMGEVRYMLHELYGDLKAFIVDKYNRPMPKLRSSNAEAVDSDQKSAPPPGTLTVVQLQQIILLHEGKSDEHQGRMGIHDIARKFSIDAAHVQRIVQFVSLPPKGHNNSSQK